MEHETEVFAVTGSEIDFDYSCRMCQNESENLESIFNDTDEESIEKTVADVLMNCCPELSIIENDELPQKICQQCKENVTNSFMFFQMCMNSEKSYRTILQNVEEEKFVYEEDEDIKPKIEQEVLEESEELVYEDNEIEEFLKVEDKYEISNDDLRGESIENEETSSDTTNDDEYRDTDIDLDEMIEFDAESQAHEKNKYVCTDCKKVKEIQIQILKSNLIQYLFNFSPFQVHQNYNGT